MKTLQVKMVIALTICIASLTQATTMPVNGSKNHTNKNKYGIIINYGIPANAPSPDREWTLCFESDQIYIYERWIPVTTDRETKERKGEMYVNCSMEEAVAMINDYEKAKVWNKNVKENALLKKNSTTNWTTYTLFDLPWPFQNRDVVSEYNVQTVVPGSQVIIKINSVDNLVKEKSGITRITKYKASWTIKKINSQKCWICFTASCDNPPVVSRKIQDPILRKSFHKNLLSLKNVLE